MVIFSFICMCLDSRFAFSQSGSNEGTSASYICSQMSPILEPESDCPRGKKRGRPKVPDIDRLV